MDENQAATTGWVEDKVAKDKYRRDMRELAQDEAVRDIYWFLVTSDEKYAQEYLQVSGLSAAGSCEVIKERILRHTIKATLPNPPVPVPWFPEYDEVDNNPRESIQSFIPCAMPEFFVENYFGEPHSSKHNSSSRRQSIQDEMEEIEQNRHKRNKDKEHVSERSENDNNSSDEDAASTDHPETSEHEYDGFPLAPLKFKSVDKNRKSKSKSPESERRKNVTYRRAKQTSSKSTGEGDKRYDRGDENREQTRANKNVRGENREEDRRDQKKSERYTEKDLSHMQKILEAYGKIPIKSHVEKKDQASQSENEEPDSNEFSRMLKEMYANFISKKEKPSSEKKEADPSRKKTSDSTVKSKIDRDKTRKSTRSTMFSDSDSDDEQYLTADSSGRPSAQSLSDQTRLMKAFRDWSIQFSGDERDADNFLCNLSDCLRNLGIPGRDAIRALSWTFKGSACTWWRSIDAKTKESMRWSQFVRKFKNRYVQKIDSESVWHDIHLRTQGKTETFAAYLASMQYLFSKLKHPPCELEKTRIVARKLKSGYQFYLRDKVFYTLSELEEFAIDYERTSNQCKKWVPPPPREKMNLPDAAFQEKKISRVHAVACDDQSSSCSGESDDTSKSYRKTNKKSHNARRREDGRHERRFNNSRSSQGGGKSSYASVAAVQGNSNPRSNATAPAQSNMNSKPQPRAPHSNNSSNSTGQSNTNFPNNNRQYQARDTGVNRSFNSGVNNGFPNSPTGCRICQAPDHWMSNCPSRTCYSCRQQGHWKAECPDRGRPFPPRNAPYNRPPIHQRISCQGCDLEGYTLKSCPNCYARWKRSEDPGNPKSSASSPSLLDNRSPGQQMRKN